MKACSAASKRTIRRAGIRLLFRSRPSKWIPMKLTKPRRRMSADYIKKNPDKPVLFLMELGKRFPDVTWRVIWGDSVGTSDYSVFVDGSTGKYLERMH